MWWLAEPRRWDAERARVTASYPSSAWREDRAAGLLICDINAWPAPPPAELRAVLADLEQGRDVGVGQNGQVRHLDACSSPHLDSARALDLLPLAQQWVHVQLIVPQAPQFPRLRLLDPPVDRVRTPAFPHLNADSSACFMWTPDRAWQPSTPDGLVQFLRLGMLWVLKACVWLDSRWGRSYGVWIGPDATGDPRTDLQHVPANEPCVCGSGKPFGVCHWTDLLVEALTWNLAGIPLLPAGTGCSQETAIAELRRIGSGTLLRRVYCFGRP